LSFSDTGTSAEITLDLNGFEIIPVDVVGPVDSTAIEFTGVDTASRAQYALDVVGNRLEALSGQRGALGALQNRLGIAASLTVVSRENFLAAESRIRDADIAHESSQLLRMNILQQAGAAVLAQANQQPALALQLLG